MSLVRYTFGVICTLLVVMLTTIGVLSVIHTIPVRNVIAPGAGNEPPTVGDSLFARTMELYTGTILSPGNRVDILLNGNETYPRLWRDIDSARHTITVQMYYALPSVVTNALRDHLIERSKTGVRVAVLLDAFGAATLQPTDFVQRLRAAGIQVAWLRPIQWYTLNRAAARSHARLVVIDGHIGYTGGFGLANYWLGDGVHQNQWRDTNVRFEGPAVAELQTAFAAGWAEATGVLLAGSLFMPPDMFRSAGSTMAGLMHTVPSVGSTTAERYLALSIAGAHKTLYVTNSYFVPDAEFRSLLKRAVSRGVDVRVLTAGDRSDVKTTWLAGRDYYEELLRSGIRIYEYQPTMLHAKTLVVDGLWSSIGSMNFDNRSLSFNNETNLVALDSTLGRQMNTIFLHDLLNAREITLKTFSQRPWSERVIEWGAEKLWRVL